MSVPNYKETDIDGLKARLATGASDTGKVWLLYKIAAVYWWRRSDKFNDLDSCAIFSVKARRLSVAVKFKEGFDEASFLLCKTYAEQEKIADANLLIKDVGPEQQVRMLLVIGEYYINAVNEAQVEYRKSYPYFLRALQLSRSIRSQHWAEESQIALGKYFFVDLNKEKGKAFFMEVINYYKKAGMKAEEAHWWSDLGRYTPIFNNSNADNINSFRQALKLYRQIGDKDNEAHILAEIGKAYSDETQNFGDSHTLDRSAEFFLQALAVFDSIHYKKLYRFYYELADVYRKQGKLKQALYYSLEALDNMEQLKDERMKGVVYNGLGVIYHELGQTDKAIRYLNLAAENLTKSGSFLIYYNTKNITDVFIQEGKGRSALSYLKNIEKKHPPIKNADKETFYGATGNCYQAIGDYKQAEAYYLKMISLDNTDFYDRGISYTRSIIGTEANYLIARFYVNQRQFAKAAPYLKRFYTFNTHVPVVLKDVTLMQFKVDSAAGNYISAIKNYEQHSAFKDSIYKTVSAGQMADMEVKYETKQKEKDIQLLQKESQLQLRRISQANQLRSFTYAGIVMMVLVIGVGYNRYRLKQSSYHALEQKQNKINEQYSALQVLNNRQAKLLEEKEWLIKEIHHRVKNNLQLMHNLLSSQQQYLDNELAAQAIKSSQHRMQAMALVHQKLYLTDEMNQIDMNTYIHELVSYLKSGFEVKKAIRINVQIEMITLDVVKAIPIGLIINEAVTNSLKYAFNEVSTGFISVILQRQGDDMLLRIADNGKGLSIDFSAGASHSFGMNLIYGLARQIDGAVSMESNNGLQITILFGTPGSEELA